MMTAYCVFDIRQSTKVWSYEMIEVECVSREPGVISWKIIIKIVQRPIYLLTYRV